MSAQVQRVLKQASQQAATVAVELFGAVIRTTLLMLAVNALVITSLVTLTLGK